MVKDHAQAYQVLDEPPRPFVAALQDATAAIGEHFAESLTGADSALLRFYFDAAHFARLVETFGTHSLFDVTNLRRPARLQHWTIGPSSSEAEYDHHAFLYWAATGLVVVPVYSQSADKPFAGAIALRVSRGGITEIGRVSHPASPGSGSSIGAPIRRSLVVGDKLFTVSDAGVKASSLGSLADAGWVAFANS